MLYRQNVNIHNLSSAISDILPNHVVIILDNNTAEVVPHKIHTIRVNDYLMALDDNSKYASSELTPLDLPNEVKGYEIMYSDIPKQFNRSMMMQSTILTKLSTEWAAMRSET